MEEGQGVGAGEVGGKEVRRVDKEGTEGERVDLMKKDVERIELVYS